METKTNLLDRELSWLDFNGRVLEEAYEKENPLMERIRFLAITASNLDEFMMVRVAGVMDMAESKRAKVSPAGMTAEELLPILDKKIRAFMDHQYSCLNRSILPLPVSAFRQAEAPSLSIRRIQPDTRPFPPNPLSATPLRSPAED